MHNVSGPSGAMYRHGVLLHLQPISHVDIVEGGGFDVEDSFIISLHYFFFFAKVVQLGAKDNLEQHMTPPTIPYKIFHMEDPISDQSEIF
jgi:hypothetical protein